MRTLPFDKGKLEEIASRWPTPFHIYDAKAIRENARRLKAAFAWNRGFREFFAVKAAPNPHLMKLLKDGFGFGFKDYITGGSMPERAKLAAMQRQWREVKSFVETLIYNVQILDTDEEFKTTWK